jgi:hypothetical protein
MLIGVTEIARRKGVDRTTVFRWYQLNKITSVQKLSGDTGALLFDEDTVFDEIDAFYVPRTEPAEEAS